MNLRPSILLKEFRLGFNLSFKSEQTLPRKSKAQAVQNHSLGFSLGIKKGLTGAGSGFAENEKYPNPEILTRQF